MRALSALGATTFVLLSACSSATPTSAQSGKPSSPPAAVAPPEPQPKEGIARSVVDRALKAGLGRFLGYVEIEPALDGKKFVGWRVVALHGPWDGVDLKVGDVVLRVNGFPIERDDQANKAFQSLSVASEIRVALIRDGKPAELRLAIVEDAEIPQGTAKVIKPGEGND
jgi:type II secretory pathway component PulC